MVILYLNIRHYIFVSKVYSSGLIAATKIQLVILIIATMSEAYPMKNLNCNNRFLVQ
jgi:hypothetical protein